MRMLALSSARALQRGAGGANRGARVCCAGATQSLSSFRSLSNISSSKHSTRTRTRVETVIPRQTIPSRLPAARITSSRYCSSHASSTLVRMATDRDILPDEYAVQTTGSKPVADPQHSVKPVNYSIHLSDLQQGEPWTYQGRCDIDLDVKKSTKTVTLNTHELKIHSASVANASQGKSVSTTKASDISHDTKNQRCTFSFDEALSEKSKVVLTIEFEGTMNNHMAGFYRSKYQPPVAPSKGVARDSENHYMFSTQFESSDARRAFPCFDEPNLKASFDFEIEIPDDLVALSNMPEKEVQRSKKERHKVVVFDRTPVMSTYLLAWAFGDFEYVEDFTRRKYNGKSLPVRVYTTKGLKDQGKLALESAHQIVDYFSEVRIHEQWVREAKAKLTTSSNFKSITHSRRSTCLPFMNL